MMPGMETAIEFEEAFEHPPLAKPTSSSAKRTGARRSRWKSRKTRSIFNFDKDKFERCKKEEVIHKIFEDLTVGELRKGFEMVKTEWYDKEEDEVEDLDHLDLWKKMKRMIQQRCLVYPLLLPIDPVLRCRTISS